MDDFTMYEQAEEFEDEIIENEDNVVGFYDTYSDFETI